MKFTTKFQKLLALPDNKTKILKLYNFAFTLIPNSEEQKQVKTEIERLYNLGIKANWNNGFSQGYFSDNKSPIPH